MRRRSWFLLVVATLGLSVLLAACGDDPSPPRPVPDGADATDVPPGDARNADEEPYELDAAWWSASPAVRIVLSGGHLGALRPSARTRPRKGGLARMAAVLYRLREAGRKHGTQIGAVSLGWTMQGNLEPQEEARADFVRAVHADSRFDAALLGAPDLTVGAMCQPRGPGPATPTPPLNIKPVTTSPASGATRLYETFVVGDLTVRTFGIVDPAEAQPLVDAGLVDAVSSAAQNMAGLRPKQDAVWIVGTRLFGTGVAEEIASSLPRLGPGIIVDVGGAGIGRSQLERAPLSADTPLRLQLSGHGTTVGVLDFDRAPDGAGWLVSYREIPLVPTWEKYGGPALESVSHLRRLYRDLLQDRGYLAVFPKVARADAHYVGSSACASCHAAIYRDWKRTAHAEALNTLAAVDHHWDPACLRCHVVGWERGRDGAWTRWKSGFKNPDKTPYLGGVGCESCHGPGSAHVAAPHDRSLFAPGGPNRRTMDLAGCMTCHDADNSHAFAEDFVRTHLPAVDHRAIPTDRRTVLPPGAPKPGR